MCALQALDSLGRAQRNWFTTVGLDRLGHRRAEQAWLAEQLRRDETRLVLSWRSSQLLRDGESCRPVCLAADGHAELLSVANSVVLLGEAHDHLYFGVDLPGDVDSYPSRFANHGEFLDLYESGTRLGRTDAALLALARGLAYWHQRHRFCGSCGKPTHSDDAGHQRRCTDAACATRCFPRTDPAVIVLVYHAQRCLLARQRNWPQSMYSVVAGFVEPGECLEETVQREVREETGIDVVDVEYRSSQPWPFPSSLMLGYRARALNIDINLEDDELEDARWVSRRELVEAVRSGEMHVPSPVSISYRLVEEWFDAGQEGTLRGLADEAGGG